MYFQEFSETFQNDCGKKVSAFIAPQIVKIWILDQNYLQLKTFKS